MSKSNKEFRAICSKFYNEQLEIEHKHNSLLSNNAHEQYQNLTYEMYSISKNNEILSVLEKHYSKLSQIFEKFQKNVISPTEIFYESTSLSYDYCLENCRNLIIEATEANKNLDKIKSKYFEYVNEAEECRVMMETHDYGHEELSVIQDKYIRLVAQSQVIGEHMKYEIVKTNKIYQACEDKYNDVVDKVKANEGSKMSFILTQENKFARYLNSVGSIYSEIGKELENMSNMSFTDIMNNFIKSNSDDKEHKKSCGKNLIFNYNYRFQ